MIVKDLMYLLGKIPIDAEIVFTTFSKAKDGDNVVQRCVETGNFHLSDVYEESRLLSGDYKDKDAVWDRYCYIVVPERIHEG